MIEKVELTKPWINKIEPFKILGNLYFVGIHEASSHLIDTGDGLILIDTGYLSGLYLLLDSIAKLGFDRNDIKYIINTHWHWDHAEASGALSEMTGAKNVIGRYDAENVKRYLNPDILVSDGDKIALGNTKIEFMETPGHTKGTISLFFNINESGKTYRVGMFGGAGRNTLIPGNYEYDECVSDYLKSINRLRKEKVDLFIGNHVWNNDTEGKLKILKETGKNLFIDNSAWNIFLDECAEELEKLYPDKY